MSTARRCGRSSSSAECPPEKIHVILHGTPVPETLPDTERSGIVFYGGHHLMSGKGLRPLFEATSILKQRLGPQAPTVKVHGYYPDRAQQDAQRLAHDLGVADKVEWLPHLSIDEMAGLYRSSLVCVLPYTGSFAGLPAATAAANGLPVVATRRAGIPDHLGDSGIWIDEDNSAQLAERVGELLSDPALWKRTSDQLRQRAREYLSLDVIADQTLRFYDTALKQRAS